ncbi:hypothetical protein [Chitinilyticum aquatile]|uniref:hypothetical protein n=1 Tax=Chitinilyticum aquatile TaxID=362520 RepID=UPI0003F8BAE1|nr:hypothetical protein [Chitinilyticum aquatile]
MSHENRNRITVIQPGKPRLYQPTDLPGWEIIGEVNTGDDAGALLRHKQTGNYALACAGAIKRLDGRKVASAIGALGRPSELDQGKRVNVYLDAQSIAKAQALGNGNLSEGIRIALAGISMEEAAASVLKNTRG